MQHDSSEEIISSAVGKNIEKGKTTLFWQFKAFQGRNMPASCSQACTCCCVERSLLRLPGNFKVKDCKKFKISIYLFSLDLGYCFFTILRYDLLVFIIMHSSLHKHDAVTSCTNFWSYGL